MSYGFTLMINERGLYAYKMVQQFKYFEGPNGEKISIMVDHINFIRVDIKWLFPSIVVHQGDR